VQIQALQNAGITPLVYVATGYGDAGGRPAFSLATVEAEVSEAVAWYGRGIGFMFDEGASSCALESSYYGPLYRYVKQVTNDGTVELSPGTVTAEMACYMSAADILQVFEGPESGGRPGQPGFQGHAFPPWLGDYPASRFAATISQASASSAGADIAAAGTDGIGNVYVNDEPEPDPSYRTLPSFWPAEVADVAGLPLADAAPPRITVPLYAAAGSPAWAELAAGAPAVRAAVVDICAPDGTGSGCDGQPADESSQAWPAAIGAVRRAGVLPLYYIRHRLRGHAAAHRRDRGTRCRRLVRHAECHVRPGAHVLLGRALLPGPLRLRACPGRHRHARPGDRDTVVVVLHAGQ
jgi:Spherulation-specific family 4